MLSDLHHHDRPLDSRHTKKTAMRFAPAFAPPAPATGANPDTASAEISTDPSYLPELKSYLQQLLADSERLHAAADLQPWARAHSAPPHEQIAQIRAEHTA